MSNLVNNCGLESKRQKKVKFMDACAGLSDVNILQHLNWKHVTSGTKVNQPYMYD